MKKMMLIPAYDEENTIADVLNRVPEGFDKVVIDDGSTDKTAEIARSNGAVVISHITNEGVGAAFRTGMTYARTKCYDVVVTIDSDGQMPPEKIVEIAEPIIKDKADMVVATRHKFGDTCGKSKPDFYMNALLSWLTSKAVDYKLSDVTCGFRAYNKKAISKLKMKFDSSYTQEALGDVAIAKLRIVEVSVRIEPKRKFGKSKVLKNRFKRRIFVLRTVYDLWRRRCQKAD